MFNIPAPFRADIRVCSCVTQYIGIGLGKARQMVKEDVAGQGKGRYLPGRFCEVEVADGPGFDCITEVWYEDREAFKAFA
jgi:hypothetical protein